ncbi:pyruvate, water dikinase regulatory protein [Filifactor villosus]|uniref:Putative pyruvate, phosphate dikinase regulatory protein n=1 Tax=Filifactor villosus TaxID=29374 RepID=A0ABV9QJF3_9FIRM
MKKMFYVVSDSLGETAAQVLKAGLSQFDMEDYEIRRFSYVLKEEILKDILETAVEEDALLVHTLVELNLLELIDDYRYKKGLRTIDIIGPTLTQINAMTGKEPRREPGVIRQLNDSYYKRVESIEFAVKYDDGKDPRGALKADIVLLGISRTSKTPLSMYLANKNIKVANIPLVPESPLPDEVFEVQKTRVVGLTNSPQKLNQIRTERLKALGLPKGNKYSDMNRILEEIDYAEKIMKKIGCPVIDVSNKAIEETAEIIINIMKRNGINIYNL